MTIQLKSKPSMPHRHPHRALATLAAIFISALVQPDLSIAGPKIQLDIPAQDLGSALKALSAAANEQLLFSDEVVAGHTSVALKGTFTTDDALAILLKGSDLRVERTKSGVLLIRASADAIPRAATGQPGSGTGEAPGKDKSRGPWRLAQAGEQTQTSSRQTADDPNAAPDLQEIVVTAQKRPEELSRTPVAVSAFSGGQMTSAGVVSALDLGLLVPSAQFQQAAGLQITIRGVSSSDGTEKGDPSAAFMENGVYLARQQSLSAAFFDVDRVEVLRGPQGTLYGRNATAGVVDVITNSPKFDFEASANEEVGNYGTLRGAGMVNFAASDDLAFRAAVVYDKHDSYLNDSSGSYEPLGFDQDDVGARLSSLWKFGADDRGKLLLIGEYAHQGGAGPMPVRAQDFYTNTYTSGPIYVDEGSGQRRTVNYTFESPQAQDNKIYSITGQLDYDFGPLAVNYLGSYRVYDPHDLEILAFPSANAYPDTWVTGPSRADSQELRFSKQIPGVLDAVVGLYYFDEKIGNSDTIVKDFAGFSYYAFLYPTVTSESKAAFGQATYHVTDALRVTGGIRSSHDDKSRVGTTVIQTTASPVLDPALDSVIAINNAHRSFAATTWKLGADYDVTSRVLGYVSVSTGYKAGGFNDGCSAGSPSCTAPVPNGRLYYEPERLTSYEAGLKGRYLNDSLNLNLTGFYYNYTDLQLNSQQEPPAPPGQVTLNAGKARIFGGEIESVYKPDALDRFDLSVALLNAKYVRYSPTLTLDYAGRSLDNSPSAVVTAGYTRSFPLDTGAAIEAHIDTRFSSSFYETNFNIPVQFRQPAYTSSNATLTYRSTRGKWYAQAYVKNIEDSIVFSGYLSGRVYLSEPRLFGFRAGVHY